jgi:hypothetical protein
MRSEKNLPKSGQVLVVIVGESVILRTGARGTRNHRLELSGWGQTVMKIYTHRQGSLRHPDLAHNGP